MILLPLLLSEVWFTWDNCGRDLVSVPGFVGSEN